MFVMLQTLETRVSEPHLYIIQLDTGLNILNAVRYDQTAIGFYMFLTWLTTTASYMSPAPMSLKEIPGSYFME
jgi:hypothetical protein